jgi:integral membrane protein (TIGR01906 family)
MMQDSFLKSFIGWLVSLFIPLVLILTGIRLLLTPWFIQLEYRMPNFPADSYGMTQEERLRWAPVALEYLLNDEEISFLGELKFDDGSSMFNQRELSHMDDVKELTAIVLIIWVLVLGVLLALAVWAWRGGWMGSFRGMVARGGVITMTLIGAMVLFLVINFKLVFTTFHRIFFEGDSWLFLFSDTLIRLFPMRFWQDAFILIGAFSFIGAFALWGLNKRQSINK